VWVILRIRLAEIRHYDDVSIGAIATVTTATLVERNRESTD